MHRAIFGSTMNSSLKRQLLRTFIQMMDDLKGKKEIEIFSRGLRDLNIRTRKIRGVKKDENNAFIRLVDAMCGLVRDSEDDNVWAKKITAKLVKEGFVCEL